MLGAADRLRYARHLLLAEIGESGQARLLEARASLPADAHERAAEVASEYLTRAGVRVERAGAQLALLDEARVRALAGEPLLVEAAATLAGAFAAVEAIKQAVGAGSSGTLEGLCLTGERA